MATKRRDSVPDPIIFAAILVPPCFTENLCGIACGGRRGIVVTGLASSPFAGRHKRRSRLYMHLGLNSVLTSLLPNNTTHLQLPERHDVGLAARSPRRLHRSPRPCEGSVPLHRFQDAPHRRRCREERVSSGNGIVRRRRCPRCSPTVQQKHLTRGSNTVSSTANVSVVTGDRRSCLPVLPMSVCLILYQPLGRGAVSQCLLPYWSNISSMCGSGVTCLCGVRTAVSSTRCCSGTYFAPQAGHVYLLQRIK